MTDAEEQIMHKLGEIGGDVKKLNVIICGNGDPEKGITVRFAKLEQAFESCRERSIAAACETAKNMRTWIPWAITTTVAIIAVILVLYDK